VVCEEASWIAFFPLKPATPGHTLVVPRRHVVDIWSVDAALAAELMTGVVRVGRAIRAALTPDGMNLISSSGAVAEQTVYHLHLHVVPRFQDDGFGEIWPSKRELEGLDVSALGASIREACEQP
jgi:histidine triad (HIT) family protein